MLNLRDAKYCDKVVLLTSKILEDYLTGSEIEYMVSKIKNGVEVNELGKDKVLHIPKDKLNDLDVKPATKKKRMCIALSKYYIKIAHIFSAILTTVNPEYTYKDSFGTIMTVPLEEKHKIPTNVTRTISKFNLCSARINALINKRDLNVDDDTPLKIKPKFCDMNINKKQTMEDQSVSTKTLNQEPGIMELKKLYYDVFDYDSGKYNKMSDKMQAAYAADVKAFYLAFTGENKMNPDIKNFSDIKLRDYHNSDGCKPAPNDAFLKEYVGNKKQKLFRDYAEHVTKMMNTTNKNQSELLGVIDELFTFSVNPESKEKQITINPKLNDALLDQIIDKNKKNNCEIIYYL